MSVTVENILRQQVLPHPSDFRITYYDESWKFIPIQLSRIEILPEFQIRVDGKMERKFVKGIIIPMNRIYSIENIRRGENLFELQLKAVAPKTGVNYGSKIIYDETESYLSYPSSDTTHHITYEEFLRRSEVEYDPNSGDGIPYSLGMRILLRLFESALPVDTILTDLAKEDRSHPSRDYKFKILSKLNELSGLGLVEFVMSDGTDRGGSYYTITHEGADWLIKYITDQVNDLSGILSILENHSPIRRQFFFVKVAHLRTRISPLLFVRAIFANVSAQMKLLQEVGYSSSDVAFLTGSNLNQPPDVIKRLIEGGLVTIQNGKPTNTDKVKELLTAVTHKITQNAYTEYLEKIDEAKPTEITITTSDRGISNEMKKLADAGYIQGKNDLTDRAKGTLDQISQMMTEAVQKLQKFGIISTSSNKDDIDLTYFGSRVAELARKKIQEEIAIDPVKVLTLPEMRSSPQKVLTSLFKKIDLDHFLLGSIIVFVAVAVFCLLFGVSIPAIAFGLVAILFALMYWTVGRKG